MNAKQKQSIFDQQLDPLAAQLENWGEPQYRAAQVWDGLYKQLWEDPLAFSNLPKSLREKLGETFLFSALKPVGQVKSRDRKTQKTLFELVDGHAIETILMTYKQRNSLCISSQAGCALGCTFCATGYLGFRRNLTRGEIIEQVVHHARLLKETGSQLTNIVVMGMGEPFLNYDAVLGAIDILNNPAAMGLGERRFTISTAGILPGIIQFTGENRQINLAVSLHAANDTLRSQLMPMNKKYPLDPLMQACRAYTRQTSRRITFEWALIRGLNDQRQHANELVQRITGMLCHVNLIPLNPVSSADQMQGSPPEQVLQFKKWLDQEGIPCSIRLPMGVDIYAGCGQLAGRKI